MSFFKSLAALFSGGGRSASAAPEAETVEYKGYRIKPAPYPAKGQFQTAGSIEKLPLMGSGRGSNGPVGDLDVATPIRNAPCLSLAGKYK